MIQENKCVVCGTGLIVSHRSRPKQYCDTCAKEREKERQQKRYFENKKQIFNTRISITRSQKTFLDEHCLSLGKIINKAIEEKMKEFKQ
jgi:hypothetical protein